MARQWHYPAMLIGVFLLLVAGVFAVQLNLTTHRTLAQQRTAVAETVVSLNSGCLTCHQSTLSHTLPENISYPVEPSLEHRSITHPHSASLQTDIDNQLVDLGQRILALPASSQSRVMGTFLHTYQSTRQITSEHQVSALSLLHNLQVMLRDLENQTNPNQLRRAAASSDPARLSVAVVTPSLGTSTALVYQGLPLGIVILGRWTFVSEEHQWVMPTEIVFAAHRSGPPSDSGCVGTSIAVGWETAVL